MELGIVVVVLGALLGGVGSVVVSTQRSCLETTASVATDADLRRVLDLIVDKMSSIEPSSLRVSPLEGASCVSFARVEDWRGSPASSTLTEIAFEDGQVLLNERVAASGIDDLTFRYSAGLLVARIRTTHLERVSVVRIGDVARP